jgi:hypothetical protein
LMRKDKRKFEEEVRKRWAEETVRLSSKKSTAA